MRIRVIDAFTERAFAGNPAAVCLLDGDGWPDETWMQRVAAEMNLSETAFARPLADGSEADWGLRWFTPTVETDLCGHATLATAHALRGDGLAASDRDGAAAEVRFATRGGVLSARAGDDGEITLDFPAARVSEVPVPDGLADALGASPEAAHETGDLGDLLAVFRTEEQVRELAPDFAALARLAERDASRGVIATAPARSGDGDTAAGSAATSDRAYDFVSRFFAPAQGIDEDPVTGSAHTALAPYWSARLGRSELTGLQASARGGVVRTALRGERVELRGHAVTVLEGALQPPAL